MKRTSIDEIKDMAITFAYLPVEHSEKIPLFVSHPFLDTAITAIPAENGPEMINVLEGDGETRFKAAVVARLKRIDTPIGFFLMLNKTYRFTFLDHIQRYLSDEDLGACLRFIWVDSEYTNSGSVFTKKQLLSLFRRSSKSTMMDEEELQVFRDLPERITVYRGTTSVNSKDLKVFSWTLSRERAEWYSRRFEDTVQKVFQAEIPKEGALTYFSGDEEIIVNPTLLENIHQIE